MASASGELLPWRPRRCQLCAIEAKRGEKKTKGVEAAVSKRWGEKRTNVGVKTLGVSILLPLFFFEWVTS